ncbi:MAG: c-type cytochrome biogenesis protein CcmI [Rhodospirillaceae bacterium]
MTALWVAMAIIAAVAGWAIAGPLMAAPKVLTRRAEFDRNIYRNQLEEIDRDLANGLLTGETAEAARLEIHRRILAADDAAAGALAPAHSAPGGDATAPPAASGTRMTGWAVAFGVPITALMLYLALGSPNEPGHPYAARDIPTKTQSAEAPGDADIENLIRRLVERLKQTPDDIAGWLLLGRTMESLGRYDDARNALARAQKLAPGRNDVDIAYAEAVIISNDMKIVEEAAEILKAVHGRAPLDPKARYYLGMMKAQQGDVAGALQDWVDLLHLSPRDAPWIPLVRQQVAKAANELNVDPAGQTPSAEVMNLMSNRPQTPLPAAQGAQGAQSPAPGPTRDQVEAASEMSAEDRAKMIKGMVDRLAQRLKETPDDLAGWQRLERAYRVLGETAKADAAAGQIKRLSQ